MQLATSTAKITRPMGNLSVISFRGIRCGIKWRITQIISIIIIIIIIIIIARLQPRLESYKLYTQGHQQGKQFSKEKEISRREFYKV